MAALIVLAFAMTALGLPLMGLLPAFAKEFLHLDAIGFANLLSVSGAGSITGGLLVAWFTHLKHKGRAALFNIVVLGLLITLFALSTNVWIGYPVMFLASAALIASFALISSLVQNQTTDDMRGRVMSVYNVAFRGGGPIGTLICGELAEKTSTAHVLAGCGILLALLALWFLFVHRRVAAL
jgi:predicted MFS family arabinose efflux permease